MPTGDTFDFQQGQSVTFSAQIIDSGATDGDVLTVQADGSIAAAAGGGSSAFVGCYLFRSSSQTIPSGPTTTVVMDSAYYDTDGFFDSDDGIAIIPAGKGGLYVVTVFGEWDDASGTPDATLEVLANVHGPSPTTWSIGTIVHPGDATFAYTNQGYSTPPLPIPDGNGALMKVTQDTGSDLDLVSSDELDTIFLTLQRVGDIPAVTPPT